MKILYKKILDLQLWHDYYLGRPRLSQPDPFKVPPSDYDISDTLELMPTLECWKVLKNLRWVFRLQLGGASIFASVDEVNPDAPNTDFQTTVSVDRPYRLTFWLTVRNRNFGNFTNLPLETNRNHILYFSNLSQNNQEYVLREDNGNIVRDVDGNEKKRLFLFLTQVLPSYTENTQYRLGQLVTDNNNETWKALEYQDSAAATLQDTDWEKLGVSQYVTDLDCYTLQELYLTQSIPNVNPGDGLQFTLSDVNDLKTFNYEVTVPDAHLSGDVFVVSLNFTGQTPGYYTYRRFRNSNQEEESKFVLVDPINVRNAFGLIEIVLNQDKVTSAFSILQPSDEKNLIKPKTYIIRFSNRSTYWHYRYEKPHQFTDENLSAFDLIDEYSYITKRPRELRLRPESLLKDGNGHFLPAPSVVRINPEIDDAQHVSKILSDIHL